MFDSRPIIYKFILLMALACCNKGLAQNELTALQPDKLNRDSLNTIIIAEEKNKNYNTLGNIYGGLFTYYSGTRHRDSAILYAIKSEEYFYKTGDSAKYYFTETKLGELAIDAYNYNDARLYYEKALPYYEHNKNYKMLFHVYGSLANICLLLGDSVRSNVYESLAINATKITKDVLTEVILDNSNANNLVDSNKIEEAISVLKKSIWLINNADTFGNAGYLRALWRGIQLNFLAECYTLKNDYNTAINYLKEAKLNDTENQYFPLQVMKRNYQLAGNYVYLNKRDSAKKYLDAFFEQTKKAFDDISPEKLNEISAKYEAEKKQKQILELRKQNHLQQLTVETQRKLNIALLSIFLLSITIAFLLIKNIQQKRKIQLVAERQKADLEKTHAVEKERYRISSELHDDLGSGLSSIRLISEMMKDTSNDNTISNQLHKISDSSKELVQKMNEIVWALNVNNDNLQSLLAYIRQYVAKTLDEAVVQCSFDMPGDVPDITIAGIERRNIFLMVKECVHNIIKHSKASYVNMEIALLENISIKISDNGIGFTPCETDVHHFGINTLKQRAKDLGGDIAWQQHNGTTVYIQIPLSSILHKSVTS